MASHRLIVERPESHLTITGFLRFRLSLTWSQAKDLVQQKRVRIGSQPAVDVAARLRTGQTVDVLDFAPSAPSKSSRPAKPKPKPAQKISPRDRYSGPLPELIYLDDSILVVNKPIGLTTMRHPEEAAEFGSRGKRFLPPTLADLLPELFSIPPRSIYAVHRIDRDTTGVVVFARNQRAEKHLTVQFRNHSILRRYLALTRGQPKSGRVESILVADRGDGRRGSSTTSGDGQTAVTHVKILETLGEFSLVQCRLETGRTHQVRIHLGEMRTPLCGETVYDRPLHGAPYPDTSGAERPMLHAAMLGLQHPDMEEWMQWECPLPEEMRSLLIELRTRAKKDSDPE